MVFHRSRRSFRLTGCEVAVDRSAFMDSCEAISRDATLWAYLPWQRFSFAPLPHQHGSLRPSVRPTLWFAPSLL